MIAASVLVQHLVPQHWLSRLAGAVADCRWPLVREPLIRLFIFWFRVDMRDARREEPAAYACFNDFFTRELKSELRPVASDPSSVVCPVDGTVSQIGTLDGGRLLQAKGVTYSLARLLGVDEAQTGDLAGGEFATLYLSPRDYHRVHAPLAGTLVRATYLPGRLFSVDEKTTRDVPDLFARNERLVMRIATDLGEMAVIMVGAMIVAAIQPVWRAAPYAPRRHETDELEPAVRFARGAEMGRFCLGSTVILVTPRGAVRWLEDMAPGRSVRMGERLGELRRRSE